MDPATIDIFMCCMLNAHFLIRNQSSATDATEKGAEKVGVFLWVTFQS